MPSWRRILWVFRTTNPTWEGITSGVKCSQRPRVLVRGDGEGLVGHAGRRLVAEPAERSRLESELSKAVWVLPGAVYCLSPVGSVLSPML
jgi:hypothetical protein